MGCTLFGKYVSIIFLFTLCPAELCHLLDYDGGSLILRDIFSENKTFPNYEQVNNLNNVNVKMVKVNNTFYGLEKTVEINNISVTLQPWPSYFNAKSYNNRVKLDYNNLSYIELNFEQGSFKLWNYHYQVNYDHFYYLEAVPVNEVKLDNVYYDNEFVYYSGNKCEVTYKDHFKTYHKSCDFVDLEEVVVNVNNGQVNVSNNVKVYYKNKLVENIFSWDGFYNSMILDHGFYQQRVYL